MPTGVPPPPHADARANWSVVRDLCAQQGFVLAGTCPAEPSSRIAEFQRWIDEGKHASMAWLARNVDLRCDVRTMLEGAASVVVVADRYARRSPNPVTMAGIPARPLARVARYAHGLDYHDVVKDRLFRVCDALRERFPGHRTRAFADTAPVLERELAARAGLGWIGKNTLLIHPHEGSYLVLGGFVTTLPIAHDTAAHQNFAATQPGSPGAHETHSPARRSSMADLVDATDRCGSCTRCIDACPTAAITPYSVDAGRCISYLTIERREPIAPEVEPAIQNWLFGCDICQEVCPYNDARRAHESGDAMLAAYRPRAPALIKPHLDTQDAQSNAPETRPEPTRSGCSSFDLDPIDVLVWTAQDRARALKGSAMKRATLAMIRRNAAIIVGNTCSNSEGTQGDALRRTQALEALCRIAADLDEDAMVRDAAARALSRLHAPESPTRVHD